MPVFSSCRSRRSVRPTASGCVPNAARTATTSPVIARTRPTPGGLRLPASAHRKPNPSGESDNGRPEEEDLEVEDPKPAGLGLDAEGAAAQPLPSVQPGKASARGVPALRVVQGSPGGRGQLTA